MRIRDWIVIWLWSLGLASTFKDTYPFIIATTAKQAIPYVAESLSGRKIGSATEIETVIRKIIDTCDSQLFVVVSYPGLHVEDFDDGSFRGLQDWLERSSHTYGFIQYAYVNITAKSLVDYAASHCNTRSALLEPEKSTANIEDIIEVGEKYSLCLEFEPLLSADYGSRELIKAFNDNMLKSQLDALSGSYTLIFVSSPRSNSIHHASIPAPSSPQEILSTRLQARNYASYSANATGNGLFQRYQFFSPGLFMGILTGFILIPILLIALTAISSINVPYRSFDPKPTQKRSR